jgi:hypothetical protein
MEKLLLGSAHDTYPVYEYCRLEDITPFIDLNPGHTGHFTYEDDFTINDNGIPVYKLSLCIHKDEYKAAKHRAKYGRHRSTKMWFCRLYGILMLQHLDAWEMPSTKAFQ